MKNLRKKYQVLVLVIFLSCSACEKLIEIDAPVDRITASEVFKSDASATAAVLGIYQDMTGLNGSIGNSGLSIYASCSARELSRSSVVAFEEFNTGNLSTTNTYLNTYIWNKAYNLIFQANSVLDGLDKGTVSPAVKTQLSGEVKFIRALYHFYLYNLFGPVPLVTTVDYAGNASSARASGAELYKQMETDLRDAFAILPAAYVSTGKVRVNKWAAAALLARIYLYQQKWADAEKIGTQIIQSGSYSLATNLNAVFLANSVEAIFQLLPTSAVTAASINTYDGNSFVPAAGAVPSYTLTPTILGIFSVTDKRRLNWVGSTTVNSTTYFYPNKYKVKTGTSITEYYMFLRYAEVLLMRAEAYANLGRLPEAIADLDLIKGRAGVPLLKDSSRPVTQSSFLDELFLEREKEFFTEMGHRWFDLKRSERIYQVMPVLFPNWRKTAVLYPIPFSELLRNPALTQNEGYN